MMDILRDWLVQHGMSENGARVAMVVAALLISLFVGWALKGLAGAPVARFVKPHGAWFKAIERNHLLTRAGWVIATIVAKTIILPLLDGSPGVHSFAAKTLDCVFVIVIAVMISGLVSATIYALEHRKGRRRLPFKVLGQALQVALWAYAGVALLAIVTEKDVASVLTGLTAIGAILVYVFRDPILGWTAGVQIAANDLVAEGDWVSIPKFAADGEVEEISLTIVKIRNWDQTISSIPTYSLFSEGFTNWRGMLESGGRRIMRSISIDATSVGFCDETLLRKLKQSPLIRDLDVLSSTQQEISDPISDIRPTNLGVFRAWFEAWLAQHPEIHKGKIVMVRELEPGSRGIPVGFYVFSNEQGVREYEKVAAGIIDHIVSVLPEFGLRIFQEPSGMDLHALGRKNSS